MITWRLNNMLLNYQVVKNNRKLGNILRQMNENPTLKNLWDSAKAFLHVKFRAIQAFKEKKKN